METLPAASLRARVCRRREAKGSRRPRKGRSALVVIVLAALTLGVAADDKRDKPRIEDLDVVQDGQMIQVSFRLSDGFTDEVIERIESGLPTGYTYHLKIERIRKWWWDKRIERSSLQVVAMYNAITREYLVNYKQDGRLIDSRVVSTLDDLENAMTIFHALPVFRLEDRPRKGNVVVRLRAELGSKTMLVIIPTTVHTEWAESIRLRTGPDDIQNASG